jgi:2-dehydro-3-deoxygluconokinase
MILAQHLALRAMVKRIAAVGECMLEFAPDGHGLWRLGFAGDTFNTIWTMRALMPQETAVDFVSAFGDDPFSKDQLGFFATNGIGIAASPRIAGGRPGLYAITLDKHERSFTYWRRDAVARQLADDGDKLRESLTARHLIYFSGITLAILEEDARTRLLAALKDAKTAGSLLAFDPNYRPRLWASAEMARSSIESAAAIADIVLPSFDDEKLLFGDREISETATRLRQLGVAEFVIKNGDGAALLHAEGDTQVISGVKVAHPVDTSGAGDAFNGAYLAARISGKGPSASVSFAHSVAASSTEIRGALMPIESLAEAAKSLADDKG